MDSGCSLFAMPLQTRPTSVTQGPANSPSRRNATQPCAFSFCEILNITIRCSSRHSSSAPARKEAPQLFACAMQHDPQIGFGNFHALADFAARTLFHFIHRKRLRNPRWQQTKCRLQRRTKLIEFHSPIRQQTRSEEHTSELQSLAYLV